MENNQKLFRNSIINFIGWVIPVVVTLFTIPFFISKLSLDGYGVWVLVSTLTGYFSLLQFGIGPAIIKFVAQFNAQKDMASVLDTINAGLLFSLCIGILGGVIIYLLSPLFISLFHIPESLYRDSLNSFKLAGVFFPIFLVSNVYVSIFVGFQRYLLSNTLNIIQTAFTALVGSILLIFGFRIVGLVIASAFVDLFCIILGQYLLHRTIDNYQLKLYGTYVALKKIINYSIYTFISQLAQVVNARLPEVIIGITLGPTAVALFNIPARLVGLFSAGISSASLVLFPFASEMQVHGNQNRIRGTFLTSTRYVSFIIVFVYLGLILFSKSILSLWISDAIASSAFLVMSLYAFAYLIANMTTVPSQFLQGFGRVKFISLFSVGIIFVSLLAYYPLIMAMGIIGAGVALLLTQMFGLIFIRYSLVVLSVPISDYVSKNSMPFIFGLLSLIVSLLFRWFLSSYLSSTGLFVITAIIYTLAYLSLCLLFSEMGSLMKKYIFSYS